MPFAPTNTATPCIAFDGLISTTELPMDIGHINDGHRIHGVVLS